MTNAEKYINNRLTEIEEELSNCKLVKRKNATIEYIETRMYQVGILIAIIGITEDPVYSKRAFNLISIFNNAGYDQ